MRCCVPLMAIAVTGGSIAGRNNCAHAYIVYKTSFVLKVYFISFHHIKKLHSTWTMRLYYYIESFLKGTGTCYNVMFYGI